MVPLVKKGTASGLFAVVKRPAQSRVVIMNVSKYLYIRLATSIVLLGLIAFVRAEAPADRVSEQCEPAALVWICNSNSNTTQPSP